MKRIGLFLIVGLLFVGCEKVEAPDAEVIAKAIHDDISRNLKKAQADMGRGIPVLELTNSAKKPWVYEGTITSYTGVISYDMSITATYDGKTVVYYFDEDKEGISFDWKEGSGGDRQSMLINDRAVKDRFDVDISSSKALAMIMYETVVLSLRVKTKEFN